MSEQAKTGGADLEQAKGLARRALEWARLDKPETQRNLLIGAAALLLASNIYKSGQNAELRRKRMDEPDEPEPIDMDDPGEGDGDDWRPPPQLRR